ncbi:metallophosphoesterase family protein [Candidatus Spongiisocius sp.]|uniref:metallophosphoesterase family protein n=1 Tax=Candidatus Spongiisocius sp. TaxID=3101273 RepID=UPI003B5C66F1
MLIVSDVHGAFSELARVASRGEPLLVLGDLLNFVDYRTGRGIAADVYGREYALEFIRNRKTGDWPANRRLWRRVQEGRAPELAERIRTAVRRQYRAARRALLPAEKAYVIHGNVDWPEEMASALSGAAALVDGEVVEIEGYSIGFAGGGVPTPARARGEVSHEAMAAKLDALGRVDILCTHVAPSVAPLRRDVVTGMLERSSSEVLDYLVSHQPLYHYFGDIHQPQAHAWRVGRTVCRNVGYFRATARAVRHG